MPFIIEPAYYFTLGKPFITWLQYMCCTEVGIYTHFTVGEQQLYFYGIQHGMWFVYFWLSPLWKPDHYDL